jgi:hypothetical protein
MIFEGFPEVKKDLWGRRIFGGWMFCEDSGRQGYARFDQRLHPISS